MRVRRPNPWARRRLTVMFCDLVDSVALGESMELEDYRRLLSTFRSATVQAVERFDGFIARHQGDGLLVYFGYPQAHEDDAERAVLAGLDVIRAVESMPADDEGARVRVGVATGPAIVGDVLSTGASEQSELAALGSTPNLAARLQGEAVPNQMLVSDITQHLANARFEYEPVVLKLKGIQGDVYAHRVISERSASARLDITSGRELTPLIGREEELALLGRRWEQAVEGTGQVALICAEPGVGKTRVMMEAYRRFGGSAHETMLMFCSPYHAGTTLYPVVDYLSRILKLEPSPGPAERLGKIERWVESLELATERYIPLLAPLLSVELSDRYPELELDGAERRARTLRALVTVVVAHSEQRPVLLAMEDLHWVDSTTRDFLGLLVEAIRDRRIFALITYRPEVDPPWSNLPHLTTLTLNHLTSVECRKLVRGLESAQSLPDELVEQIVSRTDGVPLFVEELLRTVLESGADSGEAIPETLRDALTARLDRLGDAKRVAQLASVIGRVFPFGVLQAATDVSTEVLRGSLDQLVSSGLVYRRTLTGGDDFAFKHALIRDCAYQSLLRDERRDLHRGVANALESARAGIPIPPEVIARHFADGGAPERALPLWQKAGEEAEGRGAYSEALVHFDAAMASLGDAPTEARVLLALGQARCQHFLGQRAVALDALTQHSDSVDPVGSPELAGRFFAFLGRMQAFEGLREASLASLQQAIRAASSCGDVLTEGNACALLGRDQMQRGHLDTSLEYFEKAVRLLRPLGPSWDLGDAHFRYGYVFANLTNEFDRALTTAEELAKVAEHLDDDRLRTSSLMIRGTAMMWLGDWVSAEKSFVEGIALAPNEYERIFAKGYAAADFKGVVA